MLKKIHHRTGLAAAHLRRRPAVWVALFALLLQAFVVQTHIHRPAENEPASAVSAGLVRGAAHRQGVAVAMPSAAKAADCVLCQALANSGRAVLVSGAVLPELPRFVARTPLALYALVHAPPTHSWRSRAPPIAL